MIRVAVVSHAMCQTASHARWRRLAENYPVEVTMLPPAHWEGRHFGILQTWDVQPVNEGRFQVLPQSILPPYTGEQYRFKSLTAGLPQIHPDVIFVFQEELTRILFQVITYRRIWVPRAHVVFYSYNNLRVEADGKRARLRWWNTRNGTEMAIAGNTEVKQVLEEAGYRKPIQVQTEIGVEETAYRPNPAVRAELRNRLGLKGFVIGFSGRLIESKGVLDLFAALQGLEGEWSLLVIGDGELRPRLEKLASDLLGHVSFTGLVDVKETPSFYCALDCLVLPSRTTAAWKEQFGLVLAEAMMSRVCVIGSSSGAIPEVIGDAGLVFPEGDVRALREGLQQLMEDHELQYRLAMRGYERCMEKYSAVGLATQTYSWLTQELSLKK